MDLQHLRNLYERSGPFVSLHAEVGRASEDAEQQVEARWTTIRHQLEREEVPDRVVEELGTRLREVTGTSGPTRRTLVADPDGVVLDEVQESESSWPETVEVGPLPDLAGWLAVADRQVPFALVVADREGADIDVLHARSGSVDRHDELEGPSYYITKIPRGETVETAFQRTAENRWREHAAQVADQVRSLLRRHPARLVVVAGDIRIRAEIVDQLDEVGLTVVSTDAGGRAAGSSQQALEDAVLLAVSRHEGDRDARLLESLAEARGRDEGAVTGLDDVLEALAQSRVQRLVVDLAALRDRTVDPGEYAGLPLPPGADGVGKLPADRVLVAAAVLTGAELSVLPAEVTDVDGVAALLRWA